ncbi:MAG TPA: metallophosphoesterase [Propionibacteriaceae bacterium]|nr:metallophosphoesterase [Propionibacteriaceae bacterium]
MPVVAAAGDIACEPDREAAGAICAQQIVSDAILADKAIDFVLTLGDSQYNSGTLAEYRGSYDKTWGRFKRKTRPVPGNHDYNTPGAAGYFDYFGSAAGERDKGYYSFDIGAWHFVALNSERDLEESGAQVAWLEADLAAHPNRCVAGFWHRPRWSSGEEHGDSDSVAAFVQALYDAGADLILSGHEHNYERFRPLNPSGARDDARGIVQVVAGLGGRSQYDLSGRDTTVAKDDTTYGYLRMVLHADSADMTYVPAVGAFRDSFRLICH